MLYIIERKSFSTTFILEKIKGRNDVKVIEFDRHAGGVTGIFRKIVRYFDVVFNLSACSGVYFNQPFLRQLKNIEPDDSVLFFAVNNQKDLILLSRLIKAKTKYSWLWDSYSIFRKASSVKVGDYNVSMQKCGIEVYTFDKQEAERFGFNHAHQPYAYDNSIDSNVEPSTDVFFIGVDQGRFGQLVELSSVFEKSAISYLYRIVPDGSSDYPSQYQRFLCPERTPHHDYLQLLTQSKAILDLKQPNQGGQTLRPLEALFHNRKVITNSPSLREEPYYDPQRVFILGQDDIAKLYDFINTPVPNINSELLARYDINNWIEQFK